MYLACPKCSKQVAIENTWDFEHIYTCNFCKTSCRLEYTETSDDCNEYQYWWLQALEIRRTMER